LDISSKEYCPKKTGLLAALFFGTGVIGSGFAVSASSLPLPYLFYDLIGGIGLGVGYIAPVSTLVKWFPDHRGLATGLAIMGFGFAAAISSPIMELLITSVGLQNTFYILGTSYLLIMISSSLYLEKPPENCSPAGFEDKNEVVKTKRFYYL